MTTVVRVPGVATIAGAPTHAGGQIADEIRRLEQLAQANSTGRVCVFALPRNTTPFPDFGSNISLATIARHVGPTGLGIGRETRLHRWIVSECDSADAGYILSSCGVYKPMRRYRIDAGIVTDASGTPTTSPQMQTAGEKRVWDFSGLAPEATRCTVTAGYVAQNTGVAVVTAKTTDDVPIELNRLSTAAQLVAAGWLPSLGSLDPDDRCISMYVGHMERGGNRHGRDICIFDTEDATSYDLGEVTIECVGVTSTGGDGSRVYVTHASWGSADLDERASGVELQILQSLSGIDASANDEFTAGLQTVDGVAVGGTDGGLVGGGHGIEAVHGLSLLVDGAARQLEYEVASWQKSGTTVTLTLADPIDLTAISGDRATVSAIDAAANIEAVALTVISATQVSYTHGSSGTQSATDISGSPGRLVLHKTLIGSTVQRDVSAGWRAAVYESGGTDIATVSRRLVQTATKVTLSGSALGLVDMTLNAFTMGVLHSVWCGDRMDGIDPGGDVAVRILGGAAATTLPGDGSEVLDGRHLGHVFRVGGVDLCYAWVARGGNMLDGTFRTLLWDRDALVKKSYLRWLQGTFAFPVGSVLTYEVDRYIIDAPDETDPLWATA